jgi:hypothetical protein
MSGSAITAFRQQIIERWRRAIRAAARDIADMAADEDNRGPMPATPVFCIRGLSNASSLII